MCLRFLVLIHVSVEIKNLFSLTHQLYLSVLRLIERSITCEGYWVTVFLTTCLFRYIFYFIIIKYRWRHIELEFINYFTNVCSMSLKCIDWRSNKALIAFHLVLQSTTLSVCVVVWLSLRGSWPTTAMFCLLSSKSWKVMWRSLEKDWQPPSTWAGWVRLIMKTLSSHV